MAKFQMHMPVFDGSRWTGEWSARPVEEHVAPTLHSLRMPGRYWIISDAQLKRDLRGRTIDDVYRENRAKRGPEPRYTPKHDAYGAIKRTPYGDVEYGVRSCGGLGITAPHFTVREEYLAWCAARGHTPHPASIDSDHPMHKAQRERCPRRETIST